MSAHSYHAARRQPSASSPARSSSVIAAALGTRARRFSFVEFAEEVAEEVEEAAGAAAAAAVAPVAEPSSVQVPRGTVLDGAAILFTAIASFPALSLPWSVSTMTLGPGVAALALCGVATAIYSCWIVSYLVGYHPKKEKTEKKEVGAEKKGAAAAESGSGNGNESDDESDFRHQRYHDVAASILGRGAASTFVTPVQVVVCFGICVRSFFFLSFLF